MWVFKMGYKEAKDIMPTFGDITKFSIYVICVVNGRNWI